MNDSTRRPDASSPALHTDSRPRPGIGAGRFALGILTACALLVGGCRSTAPAGGSGAAEPATTSGDGEIGAGGLGSPGRHSDGAVASAAAVAERLANDPLTLIRREPPERDLADLAVRLGRVEQVGQEEISRVASETAIPRTVGDIEEFWVHDIVGDRYFKITARLEVVTDAAWFWVQDDQAFDAQGLARGAQAFSREIYPELRRVFGSEWSPGVDGDPRVHVLHHEPIPGVAGFFSSTDEYVAAVEPYSNEREMFYVNLSTYAPGSHDYLQLLAHEYQHMIHWHRDRGEPVWVNEGLSELAPYLVGYGRQTGADLIARPDTQLTRWEDSGSNGAHYAASFLFFAWLWAQHGEPVLEALLAAEGNGEVGIEQALESIGRPTSFSEAFLDWTVANLVNDRGIEDGRFGYDHVSVRKINPRAMPAPGADTTVEQFGADYWDITGLVEDGSLDLRFEGAAGVPLLDESASAQGNLWWSGRGDDIDSRLTRRFDLSAVEQATLRMRSWWSIEEAWDYGYVMASADDGATWKVLASEHTTTRNPNGNSFGSARTGASPGWVVEEFDLGAFVGGEMLLRFEMVTDDAVSLAGWAIDDLEIEAIGYREDLDSAPQGPEGEWQAEGWWPLDPTLPQRWGVRTVMRSREGGALGLQVVDHTVTPGQTDTLRLDEVPDDATLTLIISGLTHATRNPASYRLWSPVQGTPPAGYP